MDTATIRALNALNTHFYAHIADSFAQTRQYPWTGWEQLLDTINTQEPLSILDLGCGTGRFFEFIHSRANVLSYTGIDSSSQLLDSARETTQHSLTKTHIKNLDIVKSLLADSLESDISAQFDLIVLFGVIHHVPSEQLRKKLLQTCKKLLKPGGSIVVASWQCGHPRFEPILLDEVRAHSEVAKHIKNTDLEVGDLFLSWQHTTGVYRYCHWIKPNQFSPYIPDEMSVVSSFLADGQTQDLNAYTVLV